MQLQDLKWWAWTIIGLVVGLGLSYSYSNWDRSGQFESGNRQRFQQDLLRQERQAEGNPPRITGITIHPTVNPDTLRVTYGQIDLQRQAYVTREFVDKAPFDIEVPNGTDFGRRNPAPDVRAYLDAVKAANPDVALDYRWAFWEEPRWTYGLFTGASVLVIGVAWPILLRLLVGAGFGRPPKPEAEYDLSRFGQGSAEPVAAAAERDPASEEADLAAVTAAYEARIGKNIDEDEEVESAIAEAQATQQPVRKLISGAAAQEIATKTAEEEDREYKGEFYPVARPVHHKDDEAKR